MTGEQLKQHLIKTGYQLKDIAEKLDMSQQNFTAALKVADVKTGLLERLSSVLDLPISYFFDEHPEIVNTAVRGDNNAVAGINSTAQTGADPDMMNKLLDEITALRRQNEKLTDALLNK